MSALEALSRAQGVGLDLVEVAPNATPPVCKIMDYGKFQYEKSKRSKEAKKNQSRVVVKEVQFRSDTAEHDYQFKKRHVEDFLSQGHKVRAAVRFRGREMMHTHLGQEMLMRLAQDVSEVGAIELAPRMESQVMFMVLAPKSEK